MSVRLMLACGGCDATAEVGPLRKQWVPILASRRAAKLERQLAHLPRDIARLLKVGGIKPITNYAGRVRDRKASR